MSADLRILWRAVDEAERDLRCAVRIRLSRRTPEASADVVEAILVLHYAVAAATAAASQ